MKKLIIGIVILLGVSAGIAYKNDLYRLYLDVSGRLPELQKVGEALNQIKENISTPPPLKSTGTVLGSLNGDEVIRLTNLQRAKAGLPSLKENSKLNVSAKAKAEDMISRQYFEHESPTGERVSDLVGISGYKYIILGENLAMGNFADDQDLVQAWMDSPGHRENILNPNYQEIGVSAVKGMFEGKEIWMAVQHFGASTASCPKINESLKTRIESNMEEIERLNQTLDILRNQINTRKEANDFKDLVNQYNGLVEQNRTLVNQYNSQVKEFNNCLSGMTQ